MNDSDKDPLIEKKVTPEMRRTAWQEFFKREKKFLVLGSLFPTAMLIFMSYFIIENLVYYVSDDKAPAEIIVFMGGFLFFILIAWCGFLFAVIAKFAKAQGFKKPVILRWLGNVGISYNCIRSSYVSRFWRRVYIVAIGLCLIGVPYLMLINRYLLAD